MGYYVSSMIGIRTGGVFSGKTDMKDLKKRVSRVLKEMEQEKIPIDINAGNPSHCMSHELEAHKGAYVVIAGVFNYWKYAGTSEFARRLSKELGVDVMVMTWDEEINEVWSGVFLDGKPLNEVAEDPIRRIVRRVT